MGALACTTDTTKDLGVELGGGAGQTTITISLEGSRTQLGEKADGVYPLTWSEGDKISINGIASEAAQIDASNPALATFVINGAPEAPYCIAYPVATNGQVSFKAEQNHLADQASFESGVATMYGYNDSSLGVQLKHLTGVLKIGITGNATLSHAQISTVDRAPIAGNFALDFVSGELTKTDSSKEVITYSFGEEGLTLTDKAQYIHVVVPGGRYDELYVTLYEKGTSGNIMYATIKADDTKPLVAGNVREFNNSIAYAPNATGYVVYNYESLLGFAEAVKSATEAAPFTKEVIFAADVEIPADTTWASIEGYTGTIQGNGYAIKGLTTPLFATTTANIKGLHLEGVNIVETENDVLGAFARVYGGQMSHCSASGTMQINNTTYDEAAAEDYTNINIGGLIGRTQAANVSDCVNNIDITISSLTKADSANSYSPVIGGCIGMATGGTILEGLTNNGDVVYDSVHGTKSAFYISGVLGRAGTVTSAPIDLISIKNCTNNGKVTATETSVRTSTAVISGVIGTATGATECDQLHNTGEVSDYATTTYSKNGTYIAGVAGYYIYNSATNFSNSGAIKSCGKKYAVWIGGVTGHWDKASASSFIHDNFDNSGTIEVSGTHTNNVHVGGVFAYPQKSPKKYNCDNSGDIIISGSVGGQLKCGGLLSTQWGQYTDGNKNCSNSGNIHVTSTVVLSDTAFIGGLVGLGNNSTGSVYKNVVSCYNTGNILVEATAKNNLYVGGLIGGQSTGAVFTDCYNTGSVTVKAQGATTETSVGGISGGAYGGATRDSKYEGCYNEGAVLVEVPSGGLAGGVYVAGLVGRVVPSTHTHMAAFIECENRGSVTLKGSLCEVERAKDEEPAKACVGGIVGLFKSTDSRNLTITDCTTTSTGAITVEATSSKKVYVGGILGHSEGTATLSGNTPAAPISIIGTYKDAFYVGGIAGCHVGTKVQTLTANTNNGTISADPTSATTGVISGVISHVTGSVVIGSENEADGCKNNAKLSLKGSYSAGSYVAGIMGYATVHTTIINCQNTENGILEHTPTKGTTAYCAGCAGVYYPATDTEAMVLTSCYNDGAINVTVPDAITGRKYLGGVVSYLGDNGGTASAVITGCENRGTMTINGDCSGANLQVGGVLSTNYGNKVISKLTNCKNKGEIIITVDDVTNSHIGGMVGSATGKTIITNCSNEKKIEIKGATISDDAYNFTSDMAVGGMTGYTSGYHKYVGCSNSGDIYFTAGRAKANVCISGIGGYIACSSGSYVYDCHNTGTITASGSVPGATYLCVGGIFGRTQQNIVDKCSNSADATISSSSICQQLYIGGIGGTTSNGDAVKITNCTNEAQISSTSAAKTSTYIGGILGQFWSNKTEDIIVDIEAVDDSGASAPTKASTTSTLSGCINIGNVKAEGKPSVTVLGGIVGNSAISVSDCKAYANIECLDCPKIGMIMGTARTTAIMANNCWVGGKVAYGIDQMDLAVQRVTLQGDNYFNYIYGGETAWEAESNYDGCQWLDKKPTIVAPTSAE